MAARYIIIEKENLNKTIEQINKTQSKNKTFYNVSVKERKDGKFSIKIG